MAVRLTPVVDLLSLPVAPHALRATVLLPAEFREIVNGADIIVYGRVRRDRGGAERRSQARRHAGDPSGRHLPERRPRRHAGLQSPRRHDRTLPNVTRRRAALRRRRRGRALPQQPRPRACRRSSVSTRASSASRSTQTSRRRIVTPPLLARGGVPETVVRGAAGAPAAAARNVRREVRAVAETTAAAEACDEARRTAACWWRWRCWSPPSPALGYLKLGTRVGTRTANLKWTIPADPLLRHRSRHDRRDRAAVSDRDRDVVRGMGRGRHRRALVHVRRGHRRPIRLTGDSMTVLGYQNRPDLDRVLAAPPTSSSTRRPARSSSPTSSSTPPSRGRPRPPA